MKVDVTTFLKELGANQTQCMVHCIHYGADMPSAYGVAIAPEFYRCSKTCDCVQALVI
jgi:hypothetical protein